MADTFTDLRDAAPEAGLSDEDYLRSRGYRPSGPFPEKPPTRVTPGMLADEAQLSAGYTEADVLRKMGETDPSRAMFLSQHAQGDRPDEPFKQVLSSPYDSVSYGEATRGTPVASGALPTRPFDADGSLAAAVKMEKAGIPGPVAAEMTAKSSAKTAGPAAPKPATTKTEDFYASIQPYFKARKDEALAAGMKDPEIAVMVGRLKQTAIDAGTPTDENYLIDKAANAIAVQRAHKDSILAKEAARVESRIRAEQSYIERYTPKSSRDLAEAQKLGLKGEYGTKIAHEQNSAEALAAAGAAVDERNKALLELDKAAVESEKAKALAVEAQAERIRQATDEYRNFKVDPNRYMREAYSSGWTLLGNFLSSYGSTITKTQNAVPAMIDAAIDRDLKGQLAESEKKARGVEMEKSYMGTLELKFGSKASAIKFQKSMIMDRIARDLERIDITKLGKNAQANIVGLKTELEAKSKALHAGLLAQAEQREAAIQAAAEARAAAREAVLQKREEKLFDATLGMLTKNPSASSLSLDRSTGMPIGLDSTTGKVTRVPTLLGAPQDAETSKLMGYAATMEGGKYTLKRQLYQTPEAAAKESKVAISRIALDKSLSEFSDLAKRMASPMLTPEVFSADMREFKQRKQDIIMQLKTVEELGALQRPDVEALERLLPTDDEWSGARAAEKIDRMQQMYRGRFTAGETVSAPTKVKD